MISLRTRKRGNPFYHVSRKLRDWSSSISLEFDRRTLERSCCDSVGPKALDYAKSLKVSTTKVPCQVLPHHPRNFQVSEHHSESPVHKRYAACNSPLHLPTSSNIFQHLPTSTSNLQIFLTVQRFFAGLQFLVWLQLWLLDLQRVALWQVWECVHCHSESLVSIEHPPDSFLGGTALHSGSLD